jgi:RHH-type proline utilization regulon transcriptional repressor/proline dehydrogenase/delta 1-pyrroline-5-carboxylate dehydrogenase
MNEVVRNAIQAMVGEMQPDATGAHEGTIQKALAVAKALQHRAQRLQTPQERKQQMELDRMIQNPHDKVTLLQMTDQAFRSRDPSRAVEQLAHVLDMQGVPRFFGPWEQTLLRGFQSFGEYLPGVAMPLVKEQMRRETANVILPAESEFLRRHLDARRTESLRMNVNFLGEAILSEQEAERRLQRYLEALQWPEIEVVSVKISTIYSQIVPLARQHTIRAISDRLELLYRAAKRGTYARSDGSVVRKFVYLDMEEYRDMSLTAEVFMQTLQRPGLHDVAAGIALQAYLPDSFAVQKMLTAWAGERVGRGGAPITIRIVKGANLEMERVDASLHGWPPAPFSTKLETDANYKRMVRYALQPAVCAAVHPGIASHNLFDISYALVLAVEQEVLPDVQFEMLEGMANHQRRALHELVRNVLLYAPACRREDFINAIGYLVRRLDENTGEENFLRHAFNIQVDSAAWKKLEQGFLAAFDAIPNLRDQPRRTQDRNTEVFADSDVLPDLAEFVNEPDTDFGRPPNADWAGRIVQRWSSRFGDQAALIPLRLGDAAEASVSISSPELFALQAQAGRRVQACLDPSRPDHVVARYVQATHEDAEAALATAAADPSGWRSLASEARQRILRRVANELRRHRGDLIGAALCNGGKLVTESDPEVSEAVDFVEFYPAAVRYFQQLPGVEANALGVVVVVAPWNFPIAIPCGGIAAALAAGNTVILKPASRTVLVASELCECFYRAGVPRSVLQLVPCSGADVGQILVSDRRVQAVILTGGTETATGLLRHQPEMPLLAETGGKNVTIVTALADRDQAIKHIIHSAFSHSGQKCSATSLILLEEEVYDDPDFRRSLVEAVQSLPIGSAWELANRIGPLIEPPSGDLERGIKELEAGESWALMPVIAEDNPRQVSPGIKWNVQPGNYTHCTEFFGPLLGVMKFRTLPQAIAMVNQTGYGLTSGIETLDGREQTEWIAGIRAGNLYVNRPTTGAIVLRQPFGGMGKSAVGPGIKAGGPNYVAQLLRFLDTHNPSRDEQLADNSLAWLMQGIEEYSAHGHWRNLGIEASEVERLTRAIASYDYNARREFSVQHDHVRLLGQDNIRRYLPIHGLCLRVHPDDSWLEIFARAAAARAAGCRVIIDTPPEMESLWVEALHNLTEPWAADIEFVQRSDQELIEAIVRQEIRRVRYAHASRVPVSVRRAVIGQDVHVADQPVSTEGRIELLWYLQEQSVCVDYHRYGNLGARTPSRQPPAAEA